MVQLSPAALVFLLVIRPCHPWISVGRHRSSTPRQHFALASTGPSFSDCVRAVSAAPTGTAAVAALQAMRAAKHQPSAYQYATAISACNRDSEWHTALSLVEELRTEGLDPSPACYAACLEACALGGNHALGWQLLDVMREERSAGLDATAYECVSRACVPKGRWKRATAVLSLMAKDGVPVSRAAARAALAACAEAGAGRQARALLFDLYDVTPNGAAASSKDAGTKATKKRPSSLSAGSSSNSRSGRALLTLDSSALTLTLKAYLGRGRVTLASLQSPEEQERTDTAARERGSSPTNDGAAAKSIASLTLGDTPAGDDSSSKSLYGDDGGPGRRGMAGWRTDEALDLWTHLTVRGGQVRDNARQRAASGSASSSSSSSSSGQWDAPAAAAVAAAVAAASPPAICVPDRAAYHAILLVCARGGRPIAAERILSQIQDDSRFSGCTDHEAVALLVQAYATAGDADGALKALRSTWGSDNKDKGENDEVTGTQGVVPSSAVYTAAVLALVAANRPAKQALLLDTEMQERGVVPSTATALALLRACRPSRLSVNAASGIRVKDRRSNSGDGGDEVPLLVARLAARGMIGLVSSDLIIANSVVTTGASGSATGSSSGPLFRGAVAACADAGAVDDALDLIADLQRQHRMQAKLLKSAEANSTSTTIVAQELSLTAASTSSGALADTACLNAVLNALERVGDWRRATALVLDMESSESSSSTVGPNILAPPNTASINAALGACVTGGAPVAWATALFESMVDEDVDHLKTGVSSRSSSFDSNVGTTDANSRTSTKQPIKPNMLQPVRNIASYNHMMRLLVRNSQPQAALQLKAKLDLSDSHAWHVRPDNATFNLVLHAARLAGDVDAAVGAIDEMIATVEGARQGVPQAASSSWSVTVSSSNSFANRQTTAGLSELKGLSRRRFPYRACPPTALAFATAVQACAAAGAWDRALGLLVTMRARGVVADQRLYTTAIGCFSGARNSRQLNRENDSYATDRFSDRDISRYTSQDKSSGSIIGSSKGQTLARPAEVLWLLQEMLSSNVQPDRVAYALVLGTMRRAHEPAQANRIIREMRDRAAAFDEVTAVGKTDAQPPWPDLRCYSEAVGALEEAGDTAGADALFELAVYDGVVAPAGSSSATSPSSINNEEVSPRSDITERLSSEGPLAMDSSRAPSTVVDLHGFTVPMARAALRAALAHHSQRLDELGFLTTKGFNGNNNSTKTSNKMDSASKNINDGQSIADTWAGDINVSAPFQVPALTIVTGRGKGSLGGQSVLRGAVGSMLSEMGLLDQANDDDAVSSISGVQNIGGINNGASDDAMISSTAPGVDTSASCSTRLGKDDSAFSGRSKNPGALVVPGVGLLKRILGGLDGSQSLSVAAEELAADLREREAMREYDKHIKREMDM